MAARPSDVVQIKIRVRVDLRRRLEQAAKKADRSINSEMAARLAESFNLPKLDAITAGLESVYGRWAKEMRSRSLQEDLMQAVERLIKTLPTKVKDHEVVKGAIAEVQEAKAAIARVHGRTDLQEPE